MQGSTMAINENLYGYELILDLHGCDATRFTRTSIDSFFSYLCDVIDMEKCVVHFWDDVGVADEDKQTLTHTTGTSAVCFILTSSIVIHTLDLLKAAYINIFSCKKFDPDTVVRVSREWFNADQCSKKLVERV
jgi:S-adenosylmethionine decarboxylase